MQLVRPRYNKKMNGTPPAGVTMINAHGILLFVGGKEYYLSYDRYPWFRNAKVSDVLDVTMPDEDSLLLLNRITVD